MNALTNGNREHNYKIIVPELVTDFEQAIHWWYVDDDKKTSYIPDVTLLIEEHPYMQNIFDVMVASKAILDGKILKAEDLTNQIYEMTSHELVDGDLEESVLGALRDIKVYLNAQNYIYIETDFFNIDVEEKKGYATNGIAVNNSILQNIW